MPAPAPFDQRFSKWEELETAISALATTKERGDAFERFADFFLRSFRVEYELDADPEFPLGRPFREDIRSRLNLGTVDYGIDGVYQRQDGALVAVQCKFRSHREPLTYGDLATFWSEAYKAQYRLVFTNSAGISKVARRRSGHLAVTIEQLLDLDQAFFEALHEYFAKDGDPYKPERYRPRPYQEDAIEAIQEGFETHDRGRLVAACGIGKTLVALWVAERQQARASCFSPPIFS
ncbi:MAG: DEAD/DEAH box helicase family protein [Solirubrobacterales bacterium]